MWGKVVEMTQAAFREVPSPGENIPVTVEPAIIDNSVPKEDKIVAAVQKLWRNRLGGPSRIRAEHIKGWLAVANRGRWRRRRGKRRQKRRRGEKKCG